MCHRTKTLAIAGVVLGLLVSAGCQVNETDHPAVRHRHRSFNNTLEVAGETEAIRGERMEDTLSIIEENLEEDAQRFEERTGEHAIILFY